MSRELRRVSLDFAWPLNKVWGGYKKPAQLEEIPCPDCSEGVGVGYAPRAKYLYGLWYGYVPFHPSETGSTPFMADTPAVRACAERNIEHAPGYYGVGESAVQREAQRLANLFNGSWSHHLSQDDVDALVDGGRLVDFTHTFDRVNRWQPKDPPVRPTAAEVNVWSLDGMGHDSINAHVAIEARCEREGASVTCLTCDGNGSIEAYTGQRAEADAWKWIEPPTGEGYQLWETCSEGSPVSPVFETMEELCDYAAANCSTFGRDTASADQWREMLDEGWVRSEYVTSDGKRHIFS